MTSDEVAALANVLRDRRLLLTDYVFQSERAEKMGAARSGESYRALVIEPNCR
jgi:hypothetical protein